MPEESIAPNLRPTRVLCAPELFHAENLEDRIMNARAKSNRICKITGQASVLTTLVLLVVTCLGVSGFSIQVIQPTSTDLDLQPFVGTWHAQFKGRIFLTIKLEKPQSKLTGTASHVHIQLDKEGELTSAEEQDGSDPIAEAKLASGILRITTKEQDSQDTIQYEMKLTGADQAELRIVTPPDVTAPKPWRLERVKRGK